MLADTTTVGGTSDLNELIRGTRLPHAADPAAVRRHLDSLTKPPGSLGYLEELALRLALIHGDPTPPLQRRAIFVLAGDHGVTRQGVSAYPREVTAEMCRNYVAGGAAVCAIARSVGAEVVVVDLGVDADLLDLPGLEHRKVRRGTRDLAEEPALMPDEVSQAIAAGAAVVAERHPLPQLIGLGEMGIGNTTSASAITSALTGAAPKAVVGRGTGVGMDGILRKRAMVERGVVRLGGSQDPLRILAEVGGLEIAGLVGVVLAGARAGRAMVTDGFIATAAALLAVRICPAALPYLFASHCSAEPGHRLLLDALGLRPIYQLDMRLGEGTGAALAFPVLDAAAAFLREMATFESAGVSGPTGAA
jgi:nicotinate-nucleotide--dimethylbenzimidazole phosphoribosyltransferase